MSGTDYRIILIPANGKSVSQYQVPHRLIITAVLAVVGMLVLVSISCIVWMGGEFLPSFNEGSLTIAAMAPPGVSMEESNRIANRVERMLSEIPEVLEAHTVTGELRSMAQSPPRRAGRGRFRE